jgi:hypothetical protein
MVDLARAYLRLRPRTLGSGYELVVITTPERLEGGVNVDGQREPQESEQMVGGTPLPLEVARMLACDSARVNVTADQTGALLDVGRSTRTIPPAIARALWLRDPPAAACRAVAGAGTCRPQADRVPAMQRPAEQRMLLRGADRIRRDEDGHRKAARAQRQLRSDTRCR